MPLAFQFVGGFLVARVLRMRLQRPQPPCKREGVDCVQSGRVRSTPSTAFISMLTVLVAAAVCADDDASGATNHSCLVNCWIFVARSPSRPDAGSWFTSLKFILRCMVGSTFLSTLEREGRLRRFLRHRRAQEVLLSARRWTFIPWHNPPRSAKVFRDGLKALNCLSVPSREVGRFFLLWYPQQCCRRSCGPRTVRKPCRR